MLEKKKKAKIIYQNRECFVQSFMFDSEMYIAINNSGTEFTSINSEKSMSLNDIKTNVDKITVKSIANIDDPRKKRYIHKKLEDGKIIVSFVIKFEENKLLMSMNIRK